MNILVCGDSHIGVFKYINMIQDKYIFDICEVGGATAQGLVNPNSKTNALPIFSKKICESKKKEKILIMLGEVDCGFVIWVRSKRYNISIDEQINNSVNNLFNFIKDEIIIKCHYNPNDIIVAGTVLPTIKDNTNKKFLGGARSEVDVSQKIRTDKTLQYNMMLKELCSINNYLYIDITNNIINKLTGVVEDKFLNENPYDHHLNSKTTYKFWIKELDKILN